MTVNASARCRRNCWLTAAAGGVLIAALLVLLAQYPIITALFFGAMFMALFGSFLVWAFCSGDEAAASRPLADATPPAPAVSVAPAPAPGDAAPAPKPAKPAMPAPTAVVPAAPAAAIAAAVPDAMLRAGPATAETAGPAATAAKAKPAVKAAKVKPAVKATKPAAAKAPRKTGAGLDAALARSKDHAEAGTPELLAAPRGGVADDLKMIKGVGPALEKLLNDIGFWHFDQIAAWKARDIAFVDSMMGRFKGRVTRDEWVSQARTLARGGQTAFSARVAKGEVY